MQLRIEPFSLREAAEDAIDQVIVLSDEKELHVSILGGDVTVQADRTYLVRAIFNLLTNAVKYTPQGGDIRVRLRSEKGKVFCEVYNTGSFIPQGEMKRIWQQFYKIGDGGDNAQKGTGVGLSTVKSIVTLHGGSCGCKNMEGGVEFWIQIPLRQKKRR